MQKELFANLLAQETDFFSKKLAYLFNKYTCVEDLKKYSFMPTLLDAWLTFSKDIANFKLHKIFQINELSHDIITYALVPERGNEIFIITLNNVYQRDDIAKNKIIFKKDLQTSEGHYNRQSSTSNYNDIFKEYTDLLSNKFQGTEAEQAAKVAWLLAQDKTNQHLNLLMLQKNIKYLGIANVKGILAVETASDNNHIFKNMSDSASSASLITELKNILQIKDHSFSYKIIENIHSASNRSVNLQVKQPIFSDDFKSNLQNILLQQREIFRHPEFTETNWHGVLIGYLLAFQKKLGIDFISSCEKNIQYRNLMIASKNDLNSQAGQIVTLQVSETEQLAEVNRKVLEGFNANESKYFLDYYNVLRLEQFLFVASNSKAEFKLEKKVETYPVPKKNKKSFTNLLAEGNFYAFEHNLNLFSQSVLSVHNLNQEAAEFIPSFILGLLLEGVLHENLVFYVQRSNYNNYSFLINSLKHNKIILLTKSQDEVAISNLLSNYNKHISLIESLKEINDINILQINVIDKEISLTISTQKIQSIKNNNISDQSDILFQKKLFGQNSFSSLLKDLISQSDICAYNKKLNAHIEEFILKKQQEIFPGQIMGESYIHAGVLGFIADFWYKLHALKSNGANDYGRYYLFLTPVELFSKRKKLDEVEPRTLAMHFKWNKHADIDSLKILADGAIKQAHKNFYLDSNSQPFFHPEMITYLGIAASEQKVISSLSSIKITGKSTLKHVNSSTQCIQKLPVFASALNSENEKNIKKALKELINLSDNNFSFVKIKQELQKALYELGLDKVLIDTFEDKISDVYSLFGEFFLENYYYHLGVDTEENYLRQNQINLSAKIKNFFPIIILYKLYICSISSIPINDSDPAVLKDNNLLESLCFFLAKRNYEFNASSSTGVFLKKISSNPILQSLSYVGALLELGFSIYKLGTSQEQSNAYYRTVYDMQKKVELSYKIVSRRQLPLFSLDIFLSSIAPIDSNQFDIYDYAKFTLEGDRELEAIGFKYLVTKDLLNSHFTKDIKEQFSLLYENLREILSQTHFRAVIFYLNAMVRRRVFIGELIKVPSHLGLNECSLVSQNFTYHFLEERTDSGALVNFSSFSMDNFLPTYDLYLGSKDTTTDCLSYWSRVCGGRKNTLYLGLNTYKKSFSSYLTCRLLNNVPLQGNSCERYNKLVQDDWARTVKRVNDSAPEFPAQQQSEKRFLWVSVPSGNINYSQKECRNFSPLYLGDGVCNHGALIKECDENLTFSKKNAPLILADKDKTKLNPILYLNMLRQKIGNIHFLSLQAVPNVSAVIYVNGENKINYNHEYKYVSVNGSNFGNTFILQNGFMPRGYLRGGNGKDTLEIGNFSGELALNFLDKPNKISNQTLNLIDVENYIGNNKTNEEIIIYSCGFRFTDAKGNEGERRGDIIKVNDKLRCSAQDHEYRQVYPSDTHFFHSHKPLILQLTSGKFLNPAVLIKSSAPGIFPQFVLINELFSNLIISEIIKAEQGLTLPAYQITTNQGDFLLKTNAFENIFFKTNDNIYFYLKNRTLDEWQQFIIIKNLYQKSPRSNLNFLDKINQPTLDSFNVVAFYENKENHARKFLELMLSKNTKTFNAQLQRFSINNAQLEMFETGSIYEDHFLTYDQNVTYIFTGGENVDKYQILPSESTISLLERVIINNEAFLYNKQNYWDIIDISAFERLSLRMFLKKVDDFEKENFDLNDETIVLFIEYDNLENGGKNYVRICLPSYLHNEDFRHILVKVSNDQDREVFYQIDVENELLIPSRFHGVNISNSANNGTWLLSSFASISLKDLPEENGDRAVAARYTHQLYHDIAKPAAKASVTEVEPKENSNFSFWGWGATGLLITSATIGFMLSKLRATAYSPVNPIPTATTSAIAATAALLSPVEGGKHLRFVESQSQTQPFHEACFLTAARVNEQICFDNGNIGFELNQGCNLWLIASLVADRNKEKAEKRVKEVDFARNAQISQLQEGQIFNKLNHLADKFIMGVCNHIKQNPVSTLTNLAAIIVKQLANEKFKKYISLSFTPEALTTEIETILKGSNSPIELKNFLIEKFSEQVIKKIKLVEFSKNPYLAEKQKQAMYAILPSINTPNDEQLIRKLNIPEKNYSDLEAYENKIPVDRSDPNKCHGNKLTNNFYNVYSFFNFASNATKALLSTATRLQM